MNLKLLYEILGDTTVQLRKGSEVDSHQSGNVQVTEIYAMPHESESKDLEMVDCHFITVGVDKAKAKARKGELINLLKSYPQPERLAQGPSYIEVGGVIGDQGAAFQLFALGQALGLWNIITPWQYGYTLQYPCN